MILKLLTDFYRWFWGMPPLVIQTTNEPISLIWLGAVIDIGVIVGIIGLAVTAYNDRKKAR